MQLRRDELDGHLTAAANLGRQLGMTPDEIAGRLRGVATARDENES
jgi:hypothetical protein